MIGRRVLKRLKEPIELVSDDGAEFLLSGTQSDIFFITSPNRNFLVKTWLGLESLKQRVGVYECIWHISFLKCHLQFMICSGNFKAYVKTFFRAAGYPDSRICRARDIGCNILDN